MTRKLWSTTLLPDGTPHDEWLSQNATNYTLAELAEILGRTPESVRWKLYNLGLKAKLSQPEVFVGETVEGIPIKKLLGAMKDKSRSPRELSIEFDRSEDTIRKAIKLLRDQSYEIMETVREEVLWSTQVPGIVDPPPTLWDQKHGEFIFGAVTDPHFASKWMQVTNLRRCIAEMYEMGIRHILWPGDIFAGDGTVYRGQKREIMTASGDEQIALAAEYVPRYEDLTHYMLGGNHCWSFIRSAGFNPVRELCRLREDMQYVGFDLADVPLTKDIDIRLWHPKGGVPYAHSYRLQKLSEQTGFEQLTQAYEERKSPRVLFILSGHLHIALDFWQGPIFSMHVGCFEGQTRYLAQRGLMPHIGGVAVECDITKHRALRRVKPTFLKFSDIEGDFENYPIPKEEEITVEPLFQWEG